MKFPVTLYQDEEGWYVVECPTIPGCLSQGETQEEALLKCKENLHYLIKDLDIEIDWNLCLTDSLPKALEDNYLHTFDYVVGNPPYIRIQHLEQEQRKFIQKNSRKSILRKFS